MYLNYPHIFVNPLTGNKVAQGCIFNDEKGRFEDGTYIHTSSIVKEFEEDEKHFIETKNSVYELRGEITRDDR